MQCPERRKIPPLGSIAWRCACRAMDDLIDMRESVSENRVARLARLAGISAQIGYKAKPNNYSGKPSVVVDNTLDRQFDVGMPTALPVYIET